MNEVSWTTIGDRLVVTECDPAHEELDPGPSWFQCPVTDPAAVPSKAAFDATVADLSDRTAELVEASA